MTVATETLTQKLIESRDHFDANGGYNQDALPEVYTYYKRYLETGEYPYLTSIVAFIRTTEAIPDNLAKHLETQTYLAANQYRAEKAKEYEADMLAHGWQFLTVDTFKAAFDSHKKIEVSATGSNSLGFDTRFEGTFKPFIDSNGTCYLMKPRATRKGYPLMGLQNPFYKIAE